MKPRSSTWILATTFLGLAALAIGQTRPSPAFDTLKVLAGEWEGKTESGHSVHVTYRLASGGSALVESLHPAEEPEMVTVYTADGDRLAVTHYCSANNQPHMRTAAVTGPTKQFAFRFVSATNLRTPETGHMHALEVTLEDNDHFTQKWTWTENGRDKTEVFHFARKK